MASRRGNSSNPSKISDKAVTHEQIAKRNSVEQPIWGKTFDQPVPKGATPLQPIQIPAQIAQVAAQLAGLSQSSATVLATKAIQRKLVARLQKNWQLSFVWIGALGLFGGVGLSAYIWLAGLPPLPDCRTITSLSPDAHRLYCARETARSGKLEDLVAGIALVKDWSPNHPLYKDAQQSLTKWSKLVVLLARDKMNQNDFKGAIDAINQIPKSSPAYEEAQKTAAEWKAQWQAGETIYANALKAIQQQDWRAAFDQVTQLGYLDHDYWRLQQADVLSKQILVQKASREALNQAKKLAKKAVPEQLGEAIALLQTVVPETEAWAEAQQLTQDWSQNLLTIALQYWQEGNSSMAIGLAQQVPLDLNLPAAAQDLVKFSYANKLVADSQVESKLAWRHLWNLLEATTALGQIQPGSPVYEAAQAKLQDWQIQFQDLQQLQVANLIADLGQKPALEYAITQANQVAPSHQRYSQAQGMIALWKQRIEQLEDMPYLKLAQEFAGAATIPDLQLAIAQAKVIPSAHSLWTEVQAQVTAWQQQIEKIEDQPVLDQAQALAKANKLDEAIAKVAEVRPNRLLYDQAQALIAAWKQKLREAQIAEDRSVLDRARDNANNSRLTDAIATAAEISPARPLYLEAQAAIGAWLRERDGNAPTNAATGEESSEATNSEQLSATSTESSTPAEMETEALPTEAPEQTP